MQLWSANRIRCWANAGLTLAGLSWDGPILAQTGCWDTDTGPRTFCCTPAQANRQPFLVEKNILNRNSAKHNKKKEVVWGFHQFLKYVSTAGQNQPQFFLTLSHGHNFHPHGYLSISLLTSGCRDLTLPHVNSGSALLKSDRVFQTDISFQKIYLSVKGFHHFTLTGTSIS